MMLNLALHNHCLKRASLLNPHIPVVARPLCVAISGNPVTLFFLGNGGMCLCSTPYMSYSQYFRHNFMDVGLFPALWASAFSGPRGLFSANFPTSSGLGASSQPSLGLRASSGLFLGFWTSSQPTLGFF